MAGWLRDGSALTPVAQGHQAKFVSPVQASTFCLQHVQLSPSSLQPCRHPTAFSFRVGTWFLASYGSGYPELVSVDNWDGDRDGDPAQPSQDPPGLAQPVGGLSSPSAAPARRGDAPGPGTGP